MRESLTVASVLARLLLCLGLLLSLAPRLSTPANADFQAGIRDARDECLRRRGQFWTTDLGYGCNNTAHMGDFHCGTGTCSDRVQTAPIPRQPGNFAAPFSDQPRQYFGH